MIFKTYNSIENAYQTRVINQIRMQGFGHEIFIVQEKVHGAKSLASVFLAKHVM